MDVVSILKNCNSNWITLSSRLPGKQAAEHPKKYKKIHFTFVAIEPNIDRNKVIGAVEFSQSKYCSVAASLNAQIPYEVYTE